MSHAGSQPKLLAAKYSTERYPKKFTEENYALCFECHDSTLVTASGADDTTNFRNGSKNLHNVHVQGALIPNKYGIIKRGKARSCVGCHDPHGSSQPFDLVRQYECQGIFCYTMTFYPLEDGGKCMVGCHKPRSYHRNAVE
jgi:predicted CXXCH cytochrome family protein